MSINNGRNSVVSSREKKVRWTDDVDRLVLYADIMGFSHRVSSKNHEELKVEMLKFKQKWEDGIRSLEKGDYLRHVQFSDSIILVVNGTNDKMFNLITKATTRLVHSALSLGFPIKGVLAQGKFTYDRENELYFGLPLVEAYKLHEEIYFYGIVVHHSAEHTVRKYSRFSKIYTKTLISLKKGKTSHYHLAWHLSKMNLSPGNIKDRANQWLDKIEESVSGAPRIYVDNTREILKSDDLKWKNSDASESSGKFH